MSTDRVLDRRHSGATERRRKSGSVVEASRQACEERQIGATAMDTNWSTNSHGG
jgi:hypothetical protein